MPITDDLAAGFTDLPVDALRYGERTSEPYESTGILLSMIPLNSRVLDVGCGTGSITQQIRDDRHCEVVGLEPHQERAKTATERGLEVLASELSETLLVKLGRFDVIVFADVLEHLSDPKSVLDIAKKFLNPDGHILASVPNVAHWTVRINLLRGRFDYKPTGIMDATHLRWFTLSNFRQLFVKSGYQVVQTKGSAGLWMSVYHRRPFSVLPFYARKKFAIYATEHWPELFSCQHVVNVKLDSQLP